MRKLLLTAAIACPLLTLGACATNPNGGPPIISIPPLPNLSPVIQQIQQDAAQVCGFVPAVETVASILATFVGGGPIVGVVSQVVDGICGAVTAKSARYGFKAPTYRGVRIQGSRVR